jgi:hypothetical protein
MQWANRPRLETLEPRTLFAVFVAGNPNDGGPGSLRDAVEQANATEGPDVILLPHELYTLTVAGAGEDAAATGDLDVTDDLTITPLGPGGSTIDASRLDRVFDVRDGADLTLENLTVTGGRADQGGGIRVAGGSLRVEGAEVTGNAATGDGGGIYASNAQVTLVNTTVSDNSSNRGGGIAAIGGSVVVTDSVFSDNSVITDDFFFGGGAIYAEGNTLTVTGSEFTGNSATNTGSEDTYGGAIFVRSGSATISDSTFTGNSVSTGATATGGAIGLLFAPNVTISDSHFESNTATGGLAFGGALGSFFSENIYVVDSTFEDNSAIASGAFAPAWGGAIFLAGTGTATSVTVIENTDITGNLAQSPQSAQGGGIWSGFGTLRILDSEITGNTADGNPSQGGGVYNAFGVATRDDDTVIANNSADEFADVFGPMVVVPD